MRPCNTCGASITPTTKATEGKEGKVECRRHAPKPDTNQSNVLDSPIAYWPLVDGKGCAEWVPKDRDEPQPEPEPAEDD